LVGLVLAGLVDAKRGRGYLVPVLRLRATASIAEAVDWLCPKGLAYRSMSTRARCWNASIW
jgi:hypothetical protein